MTKMMLVQPQFKAYRAVDLDLCSHMACFGESINIRHIIDGSRKCVYQCLTLL